MSEVQEKSVPIKVQGIPIGEVTVRRDQNTGEVTVSRNIYGWSDVNFKLIGELTFDEETSEPVDGGVTPVGYRTGYPPLRRDPGAKFRSGEVGLNGL